jgi:hypothetical protein
MSLTLPMSLPTLSSLIRTTRTRTTRIVMYHPARIPPRKDHLPQAQVRSRIDLRHDKGDLNGDLRTGALLHPV